MPKISITNGGITRLQRYNYDMQPTTPVSSSTHKRGCCWNPYGTCSRHYKCSCHTPTPRQAITEAQKRWQELITEMVSETNDD